MRKGLVTLLGAFLLVGASAGSARAQTLFESDIVGKVVGGQEIATPAGLMEIGAPWVVASGKVQIQSTGRLEADVSGLLLTGGPGMGTVGPVVTVFASLVCQKTVLTGAPTNEVVVSTTDVPLSAAGDAVIDEIITLPSVCVAPIVLIRVKLADVGGGPFDIAAGGFTAWIAASGF